MTPAQPAAARPPEIAQATAPPPLFELDGVCFAAAGRMLLHPLSLAMRAGGVTALVGHNGSGKSTLMKILARQQQPTHGRIRFGGTQLAEWQDKPFARKLAYLPQHTPPAPGLLVRELVAFGRYPWHGLFGRLDDTDQRKVAEAMARTDVAGLADRLVDTLSGGERQRAWLAMLVAQDSECLLLDEPISALDVAHQLEVLALVQRLSRQRGITVIAVLHDINLAARFCDEVIALRQGRVIASGSAADIMRPDRLEAIYAIPMGVMPHPDGGMSIAFPR